MPAHRHRRPRRRARLADDDLARAEAVFAWVTDTTATVATTRTHEHAPDVVGPDRPLGHRPVLGPVIFLAVMWAVFALTTTVAAPLQGALDAFFTGPVTSVTTAAFAAVGLGGSLVEGFVVDGLIAGVGMLLTFVPLMAIMFALLALLEDSGLHGPGRRRDRPAHGAGSACPGARSCRWWSGSAATCRRSPRCASCPTPGTGCSPRCSSRSRPAPRA